MKTIVLFLTLISILQAGLVSARVDLAKEPIIVDLAKKPIIEESKPGILIDPLRQMTGEDGEEAEIEVTLQKKPIDTVIVTVENLNVSEGIVDTDQLVFDVENWNIRQKITVRGQDDFVVDGEVEYAIVFRISSDRDIGYDRLKERVVTLRNRDNDRAGFIVDAGPGKTSEDGGSVVYSIGLTSRPTADVKIDVVPDDPSEASVYPARILFTPENWDRRQRVTVTGEDDKVADGTVTYRIQHKPAVSDDPEYRSLLARSLVFTNMDNDRPGIVTLPITQNTTEAGSGVTTTVRLNSRPEQNVFITLKSSNENEGGVQPEKLLFSPENWDKPQLVRIIGRNDVVDDGDQPYTISLSSLTSVDPVYSRLDDISLKVVNEDDDQAGLIMTQRGNQTSEKGAMAKIVFKLATEPRSDVTIHFMSTNNQEGRPLLQSMRFGPSDWYREKTLVVTGVDDLVADGDQSYTIIIPQLVSEDPEYIVIDPEDIQLVNVDDEIAGFHIKPDGKETAEDETTVRVSVTLATRPGSPVRLSFMSDRPEEAVASPEHLVFNAENWKTQQFISIRGVADGEVDGDQRYEIRISTESRDPDYHGKTGSIELINRDINSYRLLCRTGKLETSEDGGTAIVNLHLNARPVGEVIVKAHSSDPGEGLPSPKKVVFRPDDWYNPQTINIHGIDDHLKDGDRAYTVSLTIEAENDSSFDSLEPVSLSLKNRDNDRSGIVVKTINAVTSESGDEGRFSIRLTSRPLSSVVFIFSVSDESEGKMLDYHAAFFPENWNKEQIVRVTGVPDFQVDGNRRFLVSSPGAISKDPEYNGMAFPEIECVNEDLDKAGIRIEKINGSARESGSDGSFLVKLTSMPKSAVVIKAASSNPQEGYISPREIVLDKDNWNKGFRVFVKGRKDNRKDGDQVITVNFLPSDSSDGDYVGIRPSPLLFEILDEMRVTFGVTVNSVILNEEIGKIIKDIDGGGVIWGYTINRRLDIDLELLAASGSGAETMNRYNLENPMEYQFKTRNISLGAKFRLLNARIGVYLKTGGEVMYWELKSHNRLTVFTEVVNGNAYGGYGGVGCDITVFNRVIIALEGSYHIISRGLGNSRFSALLKYPF